MTHPPMWRDMTPAQRAAYTRRTTLTTVAEKIKALKEARKQKSIHENTPLGETKLTPEEREAVMLALEAEKEQQGTGFDYIRERAPYNIAVPVEKRKHASILKSAERIREEKRRREERKAAEREKANRKRTEAQKAYRDELRKNIKPKDQGQSKKKTTEDVMRDLGLWALPKTEVEHTQEPEEEPKKQEKKQKSTDLGYSKKETAEEKKKANEQWDKLLHDLNPFSNLLPPVYRTKKKTRYNKSKIIKAISKRNKIK